MSFIPFSLFPPHYHDDNNDLLSGGKLYFYESGTIDTVLPVYTDYTGTSEYTQPVVLNSRGEPEFSGIYLPSDKVYKIVIKRPNGTTIKTIDGFLPSYAPQGEKGDTGDTGATGPQGPQGEQGEVIYAESLTPAFMAYAHDLRYWTKEALYINGTSPSYARWYVPTSVYNAPAPLVTDSQFSRTTLVFTATSAKRWFFTGTASIVTPAGFVAGNECAIVVKASGAGAFFPARFNLTSSTNGTSSVSTILDLNIGDQVAFACNAPGLYAGYTFAGHQLTIPISSGGTGSDGKVLTSINDTEASYLSDKLEVGTGLSIAESAGAVGNKMTITLDGMTDYLPLNGGGQVYNGGVTVSRSLGDSPNPRIAMEPLESVDGLGNVIAAYLAVENGQGNGISLSSQLQQDGGQLFISMSSIYGTSFVMGGEGYGSYAKITEHAGTVNYLATASLNIEVPTDADFTLNGQAIATQAFVNNLISSGGAGYNFTVSSPSTVWTITHSLGYFPIVQTWNSSNDVIIGTVHHVSVNQLTVTFSGSQSGGGRCV